MSTSGLSLRAFAGRFLIALFVGSLLMAGVVAGVDREVARKLDRIPKIALSTAPLPPDGANYLIVGSDSRDFVANELERNAFGTPEAEEGRRSDTIMVMHVEPKAERTLIVSFPRDLWVNIPGRGYSKINAAYNDGPQALIDTLKANFDIDIQHYVELNFLSFVGLVNKLGSVPVYVPYPARDEYTGLGLPAGGCVPLDGEQSLQWVRSRYLEYEDERTGRWVSADIIPDIARIGRQQDFIRRLAAIAVNKSLNNPFIANTVADEVVKNLKVDDAFDKTAIFDLIDAFRTVNPNDTTSLDFQTMPWRTGPNQGGQSVLYANTDLAGGLIERLNYFDKRPRPTPAPATIRVRIVNASGREDLGAALKARLDELGFVTTEVVENPGARAVDTTVRFAPGQVDKAKLILRYLEPSPVLDGTEALIPNADVEIVLARSFSQVVVPADRLDPTTLSTVPPDSIANQPLDLPGAPPSVALSNPAPRGDC